MVYIPNICKYSHTHLDEYKCIKIFSSLFCGNLILPIVLKLNFFHFQTHSCLIYKMLCRKSVDSNKAVGGKHLFSCFFFLFIPLSQHLEEYHHLKMSRFCLSEPVTILKMQLDAVIESLCSPPCYLQCPCTPWHAVFSSKHKPTITQRFTCCCQVFFF